MRETNGLVYLIISFNLVGRKMWVSMDKYIQYVDMYNELGCQNVEVFATRRERHSLNLIKDVNNRGDMFDYLYVFTFFSLFTYMLVCFFLVMILTMLMVVVVYSQFDLDNEVNLMLCV